MKNTTISQIDIVFLLGSLSLDYQIFLKLLFDFSPQMSYNKSIKKEGKIMWYQINKGYYINLNLANDISIRTKKGSSFDGYYVYDAPDYYEIVAIFGKEEVVIFSDRDENVSIEKLESIMRVMGRM